MNQSVIWSMMNVQRDRRGRERARFAAAPPIESMPEVRSRQQAQEALSRSPRPSGRRRRCVARRARRRPHPAEVSAAAATIRPIPTGSIPKSVKSALVDAMLDHSLQMDLGPDEWLTVAARASEGPLPPSRPLGPHHHRAARQGQRPVDLSCRPDQARRDPPARQSRSPRVLIYNPGMPVKGRLGEGSSRLPSAARAAGAASCSQPVDFKQALQGHRRLRRLVRLRHRRRQEQARAERHLPDQQAGRRPPPSRSR